MKKIWILYRHELRIALRQPKTFFGLALWTFLCHALCFGSGAFFSPDQASLMSLFAFVPLVSSFFIPLLTMGQWAQAQTSGTLPWYFSFPVSIPVAVLARFALAYTIALLGLLTCLPLAGTLSYLGTPDWGVILSSFIACTGFLAMQVGLGGFFSSIARQQLSAYVMSVLFNLLLLILGCHLLYENFPNILPGVWSDRLSPFGIPYHLTAAFRGVIDVRDALYALGWCAMSLLGSCFMLLGKRTLHGSSIRQPSVPALFLALNLALGTIFIIFLARDFSTHLGACD